VYLASTGRFGRPRPGSTPGSPAGIVRRVCEHLFVSRRGPRYTEEQARAAVARSRSYSEVLRLLGMRPAGGNFRTVRHYVEQVWRIPTDHLDPAAASAEGLRRREVTPLEAILVEGSTYHRGHLKRRLYASRLKVPVCEQCGQDESWNGKRMSLILDHVNGIADDNRLENLQIVCPNCAATLPTHCGRNLPCVQPRPCALCGTAFRPNRPAQRYCSRRCARSRPRPRGPRPELRRVPRPPAQTLLAEVDAHGYRAVGRRYGVSDNAIRKWLRDEGIPPPRRTWPNRRRYL
jgi:hypothetical protein